MDNQPIHKAGDVRSTILDIVKKTGKLEFSVHPSEPTKGKSARQLRKATFRLECDGVSATIDLPELTRQVIFLRAVAPKVVKARTHGTPLTLPLNAPVPEDPDDDQISEALDYLWDTRRIHE